MKIKLLLLKDWRQPIMQQRKRGFIKAIEEKGLRLVASEPADWETEKAAEVFQAMWMRYPDLKAVYCSNDAMALGFFSRCKKKLLSACSGL